MKIIHLVTQRTGPNNEGGADCIECGATVFQTGGAIAYDPEAVAHTTDPATFAAAGSDDLPGCQRCTENA